MTRTIYIKFRRANLQGMLWKAADCDGPTDESRDITNFEWKFGNEIPIPVIAEGDLAPPELLDVIQCQCQAQGKKCSTEARGCHKQHLSCTTFCNCHGGQDCLNLFTTAREAVQPGDNVQSGEITQSADRLKWMPLIATIQIILTMILNMTMRLKQ